MKTLDALKKFAKQSAIFRGHKLSRWSMYGGYRKDLYTAHCTKCGKGVWVNVTPLPNDINIGGEAIALNCKKGTK